MVWRRISDKNWPNGLDKNLKRFWIRDFGVLSGPGSSLNSLYMLNKAKARNLGSDIDVYN